MSIHTKVSELSAPVTVQELYNETRPPELAEFCAALEREIRGIKFNETHDARAVVVYFEGDVYALGRVAFGNYRDSGEGAPEYVVVSPHIENAKYSEGRWHHHMKGSGNLATAVKNAKKYLRSYSPQRLVSLTKQDFRRSIEDARGELRKEVMKLTDKLFGGSFSTPNDALMNELRSLVAHGHEFVDPQVRGDLQTYFTKKDEQETMARALSDIFFVRVKQQFGEQMFDVLTREGIALNQISYEFGNTFDYAECCEDTLPDGVLGKLAVLQMMPCRTFVEGVGTNMGDGMFYVVQ